MIKPIAFTVTFGVIPGYAHGNVLPENGTPTEIVAAAWMKAMKNELDASTINVGGVILDSRVAYDLKRCPAGGEVAATVIGGSNPEFDKNTEAYKAAVLRVIKTVKRELKQSTVRVVFHEVSDYVYLTQEDSQ